MFSNAHAYHDPRTSLRPTGECGEDEHVEVVIDSHVDELGAGHVERESDGPGAGRTQRKEGGANQVAEASQRVQISQQQLGVQQAH